MVARGLRASLLVVSDRAPGLFRRRRGRLPEQPASALCHPPLPTILAKVPGEHQAEVRGAYWAIFDPTGSHPATAEPPRPPARGGPLGYVRPPVPPCFDWAGRGWRGVIMTPATVRQLQELHRQLLYPAAAGDPPGNLEMPSQPPPDIITRSRRASSILHSTWDTTMGILVGLNGSASMSTSVCEGR